MSESVLVVDDDPDVARFVEVNLRSAGYDVTVASDGEEAVERAIDIRPDLVLLDVMMPKRDGFEVCQMLRAAGHSELKIILLTAKGRDTEVAKGLAVGADAYVTKPFSTRDLCDQVDRLLAGA